ncbi:hypothetical protein HDU96_006533 [Phlyctochytrium bullatum]|nr:hypothetical protein HDU96_006533 [Phlyctochytrium bullatum]
MASLHSTLLGIANGSPAAPLPPSTTATLATMTSIPSPTPSEPSADPVALSQLLLALDNPQTLPLDILAATCLVGKARPQVSPFLGAHLRLTSRSNRPSLISLPHVTLLLVTSLATAILPPIADPFTALSPLLVLARILRAALFAHAFQLAAVVGDGLRRDDDRYGENDGKSWSHADVAWGVVLGSFGGTYWETGTGVLGSCLTFALFVQTLGAMPEIFLLIEYAKEEPRLYRPTRFHGLMLPPTPPPRVAWTLPSFAALVLARAVLDLLSSTWFIGVPASSVPAGTLAASCIRVGMAALMAVCALGARLRVGPWRLRRSSRRRRRAGASNDADSALEFLLDPDERVEGYEDYDDVIREGLDWGIDGTVESLPAYTPPKGGARRDAGNGGEQEGASAGAAAGPGPEAIFFNTGARAPEAPPILEDEVFEEFTPFLGFVAAAGGVAADKELPEMPAVDNDVLAMPAANKDLPVAPPAAVVASASTSYASFPDAGGFSARESTVSGSGRRESVFESVAEDEDPLAVDGHHSDLDAPHEPGGWW